MKIAFTSCTRYEAFQTQKEWEYIQEQNPDYLFLLGDSIYMDFGYAPFSNEPVRAPKEYSLEKFKTTMAAKYHNQFERVDSFKNLVTTMRQKNGFYAIWDDHDFAWDNAKGIEVPADKKSASLELFHQYTNCSTNRPHVYYHVDTPLARVIFLDNRSDAEHGGKDSKILSEAQFNFLEEKLNHDKPYTLICGGLTLTEGNENWRQYPAQLKRLCKLLENRKKVFFLGGDIHTNTFKKPIKIKKLDCHTPCQLISSGMQINFVGIGSTLDDQHNWATLELSATKAEVSFYSGNKKQKLLSKRTNNWIEEYVKE